MRERDAWMLDGLCRQHDPYLWFPVNGDSETYERPGDEFHGKAAKDAAIAKGICRKCPVIDQCREYGMKEPFGIFGGLTPRDRRRRRRGRYVA